MSDRTNTADRVKFADMPEGVRNRWLAWANSHDWGREARYHDGEIYGCEEWECQMHGQTRVFVMTQYKSFTTPKAMRDWAGY